MRGYLKIIRAIKARLGFSTKRVDLVAMPIQLESPVIGTATLTVTTPPPSVGFDIRPAYDRKFHPR